MSGSSPRDLNLSFHDLIKLKTGLEVDGSSKIRANILKQLETKSEMKFIKQTPSVETLANAIIEVFNSKNKTNPRRPSSKLIENQEPVLGLWGMSLEQLEEIRRLQAEQKKLRKNVVKKTPISVLNTSTRRIGLR